MWLMCASWPWRILGWICKKSRSVRGDTPSTVLYQALLRLLTSSVRFSRSIVASFTERLLRPTLFFPFPTPTTQLVPSCPSRLCSFMSGAQLHRPGFWLDHVCYEATLVALACTTPSVRILARTCLLRSTQLRLEEGGSLFAEDRRGGG